jgi:plasmid stability protein
MFSTCTHVPNMAKMIQIRHVPDAVHRRLRARAALAGMSLSDYLRRELELAADRLTPGELRERLASAEPVKLRTRPSAAVRAERDSR